jgi:chromate transporter
MNKTPSLFRVFAVFARHANLTFGGGSATIATLHRETVASRQWVDQRQFDTVFALSRVTPGTNLLAFAAGIGWLCRRLPGAVLALLGASIPCSLLVVLVTALFEHWNHNPIIEAALRGAFASAVGITAVTCWTLVKPHTSKRSWPRVLIVAGLAFLVEATLNVPPVRLLLLAGLLGLVFPPRAS